MPFAVEAITGPTGAIFVDGNGKITAGNGSFSEPLPNAISLLPGNVGERRARCPGSTSICRASCYVHGIEDKRGDVLARYEHNSEMLDAILDDTNRVQLEWAEAIAAWIRVHARGGFRWHVSGDVVSESHAELIAEICIGSPLVKHWIYTRSFEFLEPLRDVSTTRGGNLAINLSADAENIDAACVAALDPVGHGHKPLRIAYLAKSGEIPMVCGEDVIFPDYHLRGIGANPIEMRAGSEWWQGLTGEQRRMVCPVDFYGASEDRRCGPCDRCLR